jgi:outer membrane protein TolC
MSIVYGVGLLGRSVGSVRRSGRGRCKSFSASRFRARVAACVLALASIGQAQTQAEPERTPVAPAAVPTAGQAPIADAPLPGAARVITSWAELKSLLRRYSLGVQEAGGHRMEAEGVARQRLGNVLPHVSAGLSATQHLLLNDVNYLGIRIATIPDPAFTWQASGGIRVPLFVPRAWYDTGTAYDSLRASELAAQDAERRALAEAADRLLALQLATELYRVGREAIEVAGSTTELTERGYQAGLANVTVTDVLRARQEVSLIHIRNTGLEEDVLRARQALGFVVGIPGVSDVDSELTTEQLLSGLTVACHAVDASNRADVRAAAMAVSVAQRDVTSSYLSHLPSIEAYSTVTYNSDITVSTPERVNLSTNGLHTTWLLGGVLTVPIYDGGVSYGERKENSGRLSVARAKLTQAVRSATQESREAEQLVKVRTERLKSAQTNFELAAEAARLTRLAFSIGHGSTFDVLETERRLWLAEYDKAFSQAALNGARIGKLIADSDCAL